jgi:AcrR family transcriptional regulator
MNDDSGTGLPASIEAAWGLRERATRGPKRGLSLERIVAAGVKVAEAEGLAAVSMGRVAAELGSSAMSLYRYVAAKDELLSLMVDAAAGPPPGVTPGEGWRDGLSGWAWALLAVLRRHPWSLRVPISGPPITPNQVAWMEQGISVLRGTGLTEPEKISTIMLVSGFVRYWATVTTDLAEAARAAGADAAESASGYGRTLAKVADPERFPALNALIASGAFEGDDEPPDTDFVFGLERVLDGIDALVRARA